MNKYIFKRMSKIKALLISKLNKVDFFLVKSKKKGALEKQKLQVINQESEKK